MAGDVVDERMGALASTAASAAVALIDLDIGFFPVDASGRWTPPFLLVLFYCAGIWT
jgi:hypothetical protein